MALFAHNSVALTVSRREAIAIRIINNQLHFFQLFRKVKNLNQRRDNIIHHIFAATGIKYLGVIVDKELSSCLTDEMKKIGGTCKNLYKACIYPFFCTRHLYEIHGTRQ